MTTPEAKEKIQKLTKEINQHNYNYYVLSNPTVTDYDFDMLLEQLVQLEKEFPELADDNSPTKRVGGEVTKEFETILGKHIYHKPDGKY